MTKKRMIQVLKLARRDLVKYSNSGKASGRSVSADGYLVSLRALDKVIKDHEKQK